MQGTIANINNKYVILGDKRFIKQNNILTGLLPHDIVEYNIDANNSIIIEKVVERKTTFIIGIIKSFENGHVQITCPMLPKFFSLQLPIKSEYAIESVLIIKMDIETVEPVRFYDSIRNRKNDVNIILDLYKLNAKYNSINPDYNFTANSHYEMDYKDLTHLDSFNVDPPTSKDFDDAISLDPTNNKIYVHIVDAHAQIYPMSDEDMHALNSSFTLYLAEHIENILPKEKAENILSLIKGEERKSITIEFTIDPFNLEVQTYSIYKATIKIKERYNYEEFNQVFYKYPQLYDFCKKWKRSSMNIPQIKMNINKETGEMTGCHFETNNDDAHKMIETLMILANLTISSHVKVPQRYHSKLKCDFVPHPFTGNDMIDAILTIKKYKPAIYDTTYQGHFGLGLNSYTHFTSPIRRYFDVIIHRLLAGVTYHNLETILEHINKRERYIDTLVDFYVNLKINDYIERNSEKCMDAYIISITDIGVNVLLEEFLSEVFIFDKEPKKYSVGDKVQIKIKKVEWSPPCLKATMV